METMQGLQGTKIALLIDFDNVILGVDDPGFDVELVVNALRSRGVVVMGRAYGDWYRHHRHRRKLMEQGIELVETPVFGPLIKNSADIRIVLDGIEVATSHAHIDAFCLVSGDSDFLPLIKRLQLLGKQVIVIAGNKFTSDLVRRNCNEYIAYENLLAESVGATEDVSTLEGGFHLLGRTISTLLERGMDVRSSTVKQMMLQLNPAFSERTFGCNQFKQFLDKAVRAGVVRLGARDGTSGEYAVLLAGDENTAAPPAAEVRRDSVPRDAGGRDTGGRDADSRNGEVRNGASRNGRRRGRGGRAESSEAENVSGAAAAGSDSILDDVAPKSSASTTGGAAETAETPVLPELFAPTLDDSATEDALLSAATSGTARGALRRGRLRFSAKSGRSTLVPRAGAAPTTSDAEAVAANVSAVEEAQQEPLSAGVPAELVPATPASPATADSSTWTVEPASLEPQQATAVGGVADDAVSVAGVQSAATGDGDAGEATTEAGPAGGDSAVAQGGKKRTPRGGRRRKSPAASGAETAAETLGVPDDTTAGATASETADAGVTAAQPVAANRSRARQGAADAMNATQAAEDPTAGNANTPTALDAPSGDAPSGDAPGDVSAALPPDDGPQNEEPQTGAAKNKVTRSRRGVRRSSSRPAKDPS